MTSKDRYAFHSLYLSHTTSITQIPSPLPRRCHLQHLSKLSRALPAPRRHELHLDWGRYKILGRDPAKLIQAAEGRNRTSLQHRPSGLDPSSPDEPEEDELDPDQYDDPDDLAHYSPQLFYDHTPLFRLGLGLRHPSRPRDHIPHPHPQLPAAGFTGRAPCGSARSRLPSLHSRSSVPTRTRRRPWA